MTTYEKILEELAKYVNESTTEAIEEIQSDVEYVGFTPEKTAREMLRLASQHGRDLNKDLLFLITLTVARGTNIRKARKKMSEKGQELVKNLESLYDIRVSSKGGDEKVISLSRIVATFPQITALVIYKAPGINSRLANLNKNLPEYLCFPGSNALIPREGAFSNLQEEYNKFAKAFSELVKSRQTEEERQNFIVITRESPVTAADETREIFLRELS